MKLYPKLLLAILPAMAGLSLAVVVYSGQATHRALVAGIEKAGLAKCADVVPAMLAGLDSGSEAQLLPVLQKYQRAVGAYSVAALAPGGRVVAHTNVAEVGGIYRDQFTLRALAATDPSSEEIRGKAEPALAIAVPAFAEAPPQRGEDFLFSGRETAKERRRVGTLRVVLPLAEVAATEGHIEGQILRIVLAASGLTLGVLLLVMRRVVAPIKLLVAGTAKIARGDYGAVIPTMSADEIGELAASFNDMSRELAKTTVSKDFFNDILNNLQDQLVVADAAGKITLANPALLTALGRSREEVIGSSISSLFDAKDDIFSGALFEKLKHDGYLQNVSTRILKKDNEKLPVLFSASVLKASDASVTGFIGVAKDMSQVRKLEARMHQSEKLSAVGQLAAGVAHEINNPLGVILGFAQGMAREVKTDDPLELPIKSIEREALRCRNLVQNLLTFARTSHSDRDAMDLSKTVEQTMPLVHVQGKMTQVQIKTEFAAGLPMILGNRNQLEQVILNLSKNAMDAMPAGGTLTLRTEMLEGSPHSWVCLKVEDTGTGIAPAVMAKLFEPFFTTKPVGQGTGLGLSLINEIVRKHSGDVSVESVPGKTVFTVKFPVKTGREMDECLRESRQAKLEAPSVVPYHKR